MIYVECQRTGCDAGADIGLESDWTPLSPRLTFDPFTDFGYGASIIVALPEGWTVDRISSGDAVIHCPEHAAG